MVTAPAKPVITRDPLDAVPLVGLAVIATPRPDGSLLLKQERFPFGRGIGGLAVRLGMHHYLEFALDVHGAFFWSQIDERRDLRTIASAIASQFNLPQEQARMLTVQFTRDLMLRNLIAIRVEKPEGK